MVNCTCSYKNIQGGRGDLQSSAQRSSLQESQEARIDHPCVPAPKQFELLISVPVQCCAVLPFTQCWFDLFDLAFLLDYVNAFQLGYSLDKVYQVGIAKSFKLKPCRTNYTHDSTRLIWNQLQLLKPVQCVKGLPVTKVCVCVCGVRVTEFCVTKLCVCVKELWKTWVWEICRQEDVRTCVKELCETKVCLAELPVCVWQGCVWKGCVWKSSCARVWQGCVRVKALCGRIVCVTMWVKELCAEFVRVRDNNMCVWKCCVWKSCVWQWCVPKCCVWSVVRQSCGWQSYV